MILSFPSLAVALSLSAAVVQTPPAPASTQVVADSTLTLSFPALKSPTGLIYVAVFDSAHTWASGAAVRVAVTPAGDPAPAAVFEGLNAGSYAVRVFQDLDGDGELDVGFMGRPTEPYGFSNGAAANMGPPRFADAAFTVAAGANAQAISLR